MNWASRHNLTLRPAKPALGRGRVQRAVLRALRLSGTMTTSEIMPWTFPRKVYRGERLANHDYRSTRRALVQIADRVGHSPGGPVIWRLRGGD